MIEDTSSGGDLWGIDRLLEEIEDFEKLVRELPTSEANTQRLWLRYSSLVHFTNNLTTEIPKKLNERKAHHICFDKISQKLKEVSERLETGAISNFGKNSEVDTKFVFNQPQHSSFEKDALTTTALSQKVLGVKNLMSDFYTCNLQSIFAELTKIECDLSTRSGTDRSEDVEKRLLDSFATLNLNNPGTMRELLVNPENETIKNQVLRKFEELYATVLSKKQLLNTLSYTASSSEGILDDEMSIASSSLTPYTPSLEEIATVVGKDPRTITTEWEIKQIMLTNTLQSTLLGNTEAIQTEARKLVFDTRAPWNPNEEIYLAADQNGEVAILGKQYKKDFLRKITRLPELVIHIGGESMTLRIRDDQLSAVATAKGIEDFIYRFEQVGFGVEDCLQIQFLISQTTAPTGYFHFLKSKDMETYPVYNFNNDTLGIEKKHEISINLATKEISHTIIAELPISYMIKNDDTYGEPLTYARIKIIQQVVLQKEGVAGIYKPVPDRFLLTFSAISID